MRSVAAPQQSTTGRAASRRLVHGIVLPRFLRRPVRRLSRLDWRLPENAGTKAAVLFFAATAVTGMVAGGHTHAVVAAATAGAGLAIDAVQISGQSETSEVDILERLAIGEYPSIVTFDAEAARARVESLPWVQQATIRKLYPGTVKVTITERTPYAIWQDGGAFFLVDAVGRVLANRVGDRYARLPMVVGPGAGERVHEFVDMIEGVPSLASRIKGGVLVSERRWNIVLDNGIEILLPEEDPASALVQVVALDDGHGILSREINAIDLRLPTRLVVRLTDAGVAARKVMLEQREKSGRRGTSA